LSVVVETRDLVALIEPHLRTSGDTNSPLLEGAKKLAAQSAALSTRQSAYRWLTRLRDLESHHVTATRADEILLALLGDNAAHALRSIPHFFDTQKSALEAARAFHADDENAKRSDITRTTRSLVNFSKGWKTGLLEEYGPSPESLKAQRRRAQQRELVAA
jgi:hypothetical protein